MAVASFVVNLGVTMNGSDGTGAGSTVVNITVNQGGDEEKSSTGTNNDGKTLANMIKGAVMDVLVTQQRPGGMLYR